MIKTSSEVIKKVFITEKTTLMASNKKYVFSVNYNTNKNVIKIAIEEAFPGVKVEKVNLMIVKPKKKRLGKYIGKTNRIKKAIVTLTKDSKPIEIFPN